MPISDSEADIGQLYSFGCFKPPWLQADCASCNRAGRLRKAPSSLSKSCAKDFLLKAACKSSALTLRTGY